MKNLIYLYISLLLVGLCLPFVSEILSMLYGAIAFIALAAVQISLLQNSGKWAFIGGKPTTVLHGKRRVISIASIIILASVLSGLMLKLAWLKYAL